MTKLFLNRKIKLSTVLTSLVASSVIFTTIILLVASYQSQRESLIDAYLNLNYSKANKMSRSVDSLFQSMRMSLEEIATYVSTHQEMTDDDIQEQLELLRNNSRFFNSIAFVDETGLIRSIAPLSVGLKGHVLKTGVSKEVLDSQEPSLTTPYIAPSGRLILLMSQPLYDSEGNHRGMIGGTIYLHERNVLSEILGNDFIDENGSYYYVVGPEGKLLFHPKNKRVGEDVTANAIVKKVLNGQSGMDRAVNTKGVSMLAAYSTVPEIGWGVVQQTPIAHINDLLASHIKSLILHILVPFLFILILCIFIARRLAKPFFELANHVNQLGSEKEVVQPKNKSHWNREADLLTKSVILAMEGIKEKNLKLTYEATTDPLTNIPNRRKLTEVMEAWEEEGRVFSLVAIDIDSFKLINDTFGHQAGDEVLVFLVNTIKSSIRKTDLLFRYGGEEFVLLLPYTVTSEAFQISEKLRTKIEKTISPVGKAITVSLGISEYPSHTNSIKQVFVLADNALYHSKLNGRNQTTVWSKEITAQKKK
ncbi:sensor domain-containing diguanylate cyclase [Bacillus timonensis]|nr:sensor domain-containing diguanylate cyclase [Bacillus timonensis]